MSCPLKSLQSWKDLVKAQPENVAYYLWDKYDGDVPAEYYIKKEKIEDEVVEKPTKTFQEKRSNEILFQLPKTEPSPEKIDELNTKLIGILSSIGVKIEQFDDFKKEYGLDAIGVMEIIDGVARIRFDENRADELTLPEETAHFFYELFGNSPLGRRLLDQMLANDAYVEVLGYEFDLYNDKYDGDKTKLAKEAVGKKLAEAIVARFKADQVNATPAQLSLLQRFWNYIKNILSSITENQTQQMVSDLYSEVAKSILSNKFANLRLENIKGRQIYFQVSDMALNRLKTALDKTITGTAKRIEVLKAKGKKEEAYEEQEYLRTLVDEIDTQKYVASALSYAEHAREKFSRVRDAVINLRKKISNLDSIGIQEAATTLKNMHSFGNSYSKTIKDLKVEIDRILLEEPENEEYKKVSNILADLLASINVLEEEYLDLARPVFQEFLSFGVGEGFMHVDLEKELKFQSKDISFAQRFIDSMAEASSPVLQLIDVAVKESKRKAYEEAYYKSKTLLEALDNLKKAGIKDQDWMYEVLSDGTTTGNFTTEYNWGQREYNMKEFRKNLMKELGLPEDYAKMKEMLESNDKKRKAYGKAWAKWHKENSQTIPDVSKVIEEHRKAMTTEEYAVWDMANITRDEGGQILFFKGELVMPSSKYKNKVYSEIMANPAKKSFYDTVIKMKEELDNLLPDDFRTNRLAPQIRKDFVERLKDVKGKQKLDIIKKTLEDNFTVTEDDASRGARIKMTDEAGRIVNFVPIHFTKKMAKTSDMSLDVVSTMSAYALMAHDYSQTNKIVDMLEMGRDIMNAREILEVDKNGDPIMESIDVLGNKILSKIKKDKADTNYTMGRLNDYYNMVVYGKMKAEGKSIDMFGTKLNSEAMLDLLGKYTAIANLGLNLYAGIQNPIVGNTNIRLEGIAGQFVNNKDLFNADKLYWKLMPSRMAEFGMHNKKNKMDLWWEFFDLDQSFGAGFRELDASRKSWISQLFKTSSLFVFSSSGEHYMQLKMSFALAYHQKLKDKNGNEITLVDAYEVVGNRLKLKEGVTKTDGTVWTEEDTRKFIRRQNFVNKRLHGIYNDVDKGAMQQYASMRLVMMFRKFMRPGYNRRWRKLDYSFEGQAEIEGYYRTFGRFLGVLAKDLRRGDFLLKANWEKMSPTERYNILRTLGEVGFALTLAATMIALNSLGDDDDENWMANMFAYQVYRYRSELFFFIDPRQTLTLLKSPAAAVDQANKLLDLLFLMTKPGYAMEEISKGKWSGYSRLGKASVGTIPMYKTVHDWFAPQDKLIYFRLNQ